MVSIHYYIIMWRVSVDRHMFHARFHGNTMMTALGTRENIHLLALILEMHIKKQNFHLKKQINYSYEQKCIGCNFDYLLARFKCSNYWDLNLVYSHMEATHNKCFISNSTKCIPEPTWLLHNVVIGRFNFFWPRLRR